MKHLKIVSTGFETYTGNLGGVDFVDGVSVDPVPRVFANRLTAAFRMVEIEEDGSEVEAGVAHRLIADAEKRAPVLEPLERQTEEEKVAESVEIIKQADTASVTIYTKDELEAILEKDGIKGLRAVAEPWKVKDRSAIKLMELILVAQAQYSEQRDARLAALAGAVETPAETSDEPEGEDSSEEQSAPESEPEAAGEEKSAE